MALYFLNAKTKKLFEKPDQNLYRVQPLDRAVEILEKKRWAFVSPTLWNDPFEKAFLEAEYRHSEGDSFELPLKPKKINGQPHYRLFSVCFTATRESEAFWKTYSPNGDGIRFSIKAAALKAALAKLENYDIYIGLAKYEDYEEMYEFEKNAAFWKALQSEKINTTHLKLMLKKRTPFEYENEVRVLLLAKNETTDPVIKIPMTETRQLIHQIKLDPRMGTHMARMVKEVFYGMGFTPDTVKKSRLYSKPEECIMFKPGQFLE